jgi:tRNA-specific 2-thiouridylase
MHPTTSHHIIVGMSGGVDSSVAALLLKEQGHTVEGVFMKNWEGDDTDDYCPASQDMADAQAVCDLLDIPLHRVNFAAEYWETVFTHFLAEYRAGRTPNPDILCNREIKFSAFLNYARQRGADFIATGHYARTAIQQDRVFLLKGKDNQKDQSYFLHALGQEQLKYSLFPLGDIEKSTVRDLAEKAGFLNHRKKDSTGICFIGERKFKTFLSEYLPARPGPMETPAGEHLGTHDGLMFYTIGQRQGLKIGGIKAASESPWYVAGKDMARNTLIVTQDQTLLDAQALIATQVHWINGTPPAFPITLTAKTRYRQPDQACTVTQRNADEYEIIFNAPQRAITAGQSVVFYQEDICLGGGIIVRAVVYAGALA